MKGIAVLATLTIHVDPYIELGPVTVAWHGLMIAVGIVVGAWMAVLYARERGLDPDEIVTTAMVVAVAGIAGARLFFLLETDPGGLLRPGDWFGTHGFAFYGAILLGAPAGALYLRYRSLGLPYLDALAAGFPLGMAVGRVGDLVNGEHYGPESGLPWAIRYAHPDAEVPSALVAYHPGGLYEIVLALALFAVIWPLRHRFRPPGTLLLAVVGLYSVGRFAMFFYRLDSDDLALGLNGAQWTSLSLIAVSAAGIWWARRARPPDGGEAKPREPATAD